MPYRHAHWFILALFPLAGLAFWQSYLSTFASSPVQFHLHGATASLWLLLLAAQSLTIQAGRRRLHRSFGLTSLLLFPLFLAGGAGIFIGMAQRLVEGSSPFYAMYAARLAWIDIVSVAAFALCYHEALRLRRQVQLHSRYVLATALFLMPPILGRLAPVLPPLAIAGPQDFWKLGIGFQLANVVTAAIAFWLASRSRRHGTPFVIAGLAVLLAGLLYQTVGGWGPWETLLRSAADLPILPVSVVTGLAGIAIAASGWIGGRTVGPRRPLATA